MNILFVCTSNKDRSPALEKYFSDNYPEHTFKSAGINKYFCEKKGTHYLDLSDLKYADMIVYCEPIHASRTHEILGDKDNTIIKLTFPSSDEMGVEHKTEGWKKRIKEKTLSLGNYQQGCIAEDYLMRAEQSLKLYLK